MTREEYVEKLKSQLDRWNAEMSRWEGKIREAQSGMKAEYERQLESLKSRRDEVLYQMKLAQGASAGAWTEIARGADQAWKSMQEAVERARAYFEKK